MTRFHAQDSANGASKIPTIVYCDAFGNVRAVGVEETRSGSQAGVGQSRVVRAPYLVLQLPVLVVHSLSGLSCTCAPPLLAAVPPARQSRKRAVDVLADFLSYLRA